MTPVVAHIGHQFDGTVISWFVLDPLALAVVLTASVLYIRAGRTLRARGRRIPRAQQLAWWTGIACLVLGLLTVIDPLGATSLVSAHMLQHLLIADLAGMFLLMGARSPVALFIWPRSVVRLVGGSDRFRRMWAVITRPGPSMALWLATLYAWHFPGLYEAALGNAAIHLLQHASFVVTGIIAWWPILNPTRRTVRGELWKTFYVGVERGFGTAVLGMFFIFAPFQVYGGFYGDRPQDFGIDPLLDQQIAGAMMMGVDMLIVFGSFIFFALRSASDHERGLTDPRDADREAAVAMRQADEADPPASAGTRELVGK